METTTTNGNGWCLHLEARATANRAHHHITSSLKLKLQPPEHIGSEISLPRLNMLPDNATPQPQGTLNFNFSFSFSFSLTYTGYWVFRLMGFSLSQSLSLYLKNESENMKWNESLSLSLFLRLYPFLFELWFSDWLIAFAYHYFITLLIFVCPCFWLYPLVLVRYN